VENIKKRFEKARKTHIRWRVLKLTFSVLTATGCISLSPFEQGDEEQMTKTRVTKSRRRTSASV
jgi:hypothetical protein